MLINKFQTILNKDKQKKNWKNSINKVRTDKYIFIFIRNNLMFIENGKNSFFSSKEWDNVSYCNFSIKPALLLHND